LGRFLLFLNRWKQSKMHNAGTFLKGADSK